MANLKEVEGTYGGSKTPATILVCENRDGSSWYVAEGSVNVNKTYDSIEDGVNIEELSDDDVFTASKPINSLSDLEASINDEPYAKGGKAGEKKDLPTWKYTSGMEWSPNQVLELFREKAKEKYGRVLDEQEEIELMTEAKEQHEHGLDIDNILNILEIYFGSEPDGGEMGKGGKVTSKDLLERLKAGEKISENEVNLIKNRMNAGKEDEDSKELVQWIWDNQPELTPEQNKKGVDFLKNLWKSPTGKVRSSNPFGHREEQALETFEHFTLDGFHDASRGGGRSFYIPIYGVYGSGGNFQYYYDSEGVHIIGAKGGKMGKGGGVGDRMYNFMKDDLVKLKKAIEENDKEETDRFFSYWNGNNGNGHLKSLAPKKGSDRMYNFMKDDLVKLEKAIEENDKEETDRFFSYWSIHLKSLSSSGGSMATGGGVEKKYGVKGKDNYWFDWNAMTYSEKLTLVRESGLPEKVASLEIGVITPPQISRMKDSIRMRIITGGSMATGGEAGDVKNNLTDLFGKLKSYLDQSYSQMSNPQMAIGKWMGGQSSMDEGAKKIFNQLGIDLGTEYKSIEIPSMAVDKWAVENKIEMAKGGNVKSNTVNNFWNSFCDDGALIFGGSYFKASPTEKKGLGGFLLGLGIGAGTGYVFRDVITKKKEQAKWKVMEAVDRLEKGGKAGDSDLTVDEKSAIKSHLAGLGVSDASMSKIIAMVNDVRSGKRYLSDTVADTDVSISDIMDSLKLNDYVPAEVMGKGGSAKSGIARDRKYTSKEEHEKAYKDHRKSRVRYYKKGD